MRYLIPLMLLAGAAMGADLDTRHFYVTNDVSSARPAVTPLRWYQGESVKLDLYVRRGTNAVDLTASGLYPRWEVFLATNQTSAFIMNTGTVANGTNGYLTFSLTPALANLPTNTYLSYVKLYQPIGGTNTYVGMAYKADLQVYWSPSATNFTYQGPYTNAPAYVSQIVMTDQGTATSTGTTWYLDIDAANLSGLSSTQATHTTAINGLSSTQATAVAGISGLSSTQATLVAQSTAISNLAQSAYDTGIIVSNWGNHASAGYFKADGSVPMAGDINMGGNGVTNTTAIIDLTGNAALNVIAHTLNDSSGNARVYATERILDGGVWTAHVTYASAAGVASNVTEGVTNGIIGTASNSFFTVTAGNALSSTQATHTAAINGLSTTQALVTAITDTYIVTNIVYGGTTGTTGKVDRTANNTFTLTFPTNDVDVPLDGSEAMTGDLNMGGNDVTNLISLLFNTSGMIVSNGVLNGTNAFVINLASTNYFILLATP